MEDAVRGDGVHWGKQGRCPARSHPETQSGKQMSGAGVPGEEMKGLRVADETSGTVPGLLHLVVAPNGGLFSLICFLSLVLFFSFLSSLLFRPTKQNEVEFSGASNAKQSSNLKERRTKKELRESERESGQRNQQQKGQKRMVK